MLRAAVSAYVLVIAMLSQARAQENIRVRVDAHPFSPMVYANNHGEMRGFEIELLERIARIADLELEYRNIATFDKIFDGLRDGSADLAVAGISMLPRREREFDFTHPTVRGGLSLMMHSRGASPEYKFWDLLVHMSPGVGVLVVILICAASNYNIERKTDPETTYRREFWQAFYFCIFGEITSELPKTNFGRWMSAGSGLSAKLLAMLQTALFVTYLQKDYHGPVYTDKTELANREVVTVAGTSSVEAARDLNAKVIEVPTIDEAIALLRQRRVIAVMFDGIELKYLAGNKTEYAFLDNVREEDYSFALPHDSPLRERINRALLELRRTGEYEEIKEKYKTYF